MKMEIYHQGCIFVIGSSFMQWLNLSKDESNPFAILARSGGQRQTDTLTVFPLPERDEDGLYHFYFPLQKLRDLRPLPVICIFEGYLDE